MNSMGCQILPGGSCRWRRRLVCGAEVYGSELVSNSVLLYRIYWQSVECILYVLDH